MSSANFFTGYANDKPSSKVINPPGGRSNNIFGAHEDNATTVANNKSRNQTSSIFFGDDSTPQNHTRPNQATHNNNRQKSSIFGDDTSKENNSKDTRKGYNPITGKMYENNQMAESHQAHQAPPAAAPAPAPEQHKREEEEQHQQQNGKPLHTSSRVLQPPGGKSHGLW